MTISDKNMALLTKAYYDPSIGFSGARKLYEHLKTQGVTFREVQEFIKNQQVAQTHAKNVHNNSFIPNHIKQEFQIDLIYLENKYLNQGNKYGLTCIDIFTKRGHCELLKKKDNADVLNGMKRILKVMGIPESVYSDEGTEFKSAQFQKLMADNNIKQVFSLSHAPYIERFNRTIKELLQKYLDASKSKTIVNVLPKILQNYNSSYHSAISMAPNDVNEQNQQLAFHSILTHSKKEKIPEPINIGDKVRFQVKPKTFEKRYKHQFSTDVHEVLEKNNGQYKVSGINRLYTRGNLQKVGDVQHVQIKPDLEGTREGHLRQLHQQRANKPAETVKTVKKTPATSIATTRTRRTIVKPARYGFGKK